MSINPFDGKAVQKSENIEEEVPSRKCLKRRRLDPGCQKLRPASVSHKAYLETMFKINQS